MNKKMYLGYLKFVSVFVIMLVLGLPVYASSTFAALTVSTNQGSDGVDGFINAEEDTWELKVNARIEGEAVEADRVSVNGFLFQDCVTGIAGSYDCSYSFEYSNSITEGAYPFEVRLLSRTGTLVNTATGRITADGSAPLLSNLLARQAEGGARVTFTVQEQPTRCVGLADVKIINADNGNVLASLSGASGCGEQNFDETVSLSNIGAGLQAIRVVATDVFGHSTSAVDTFAFDHVAPVINGSTFKIGGFDAFVPGGSVTADISVDVEEGSDFVSLVGTSTALGLAGDEADCSYVAARDVFSCVWAGQQINLEEGSLSVVLTASDGSNSQTVTISPSFVLDNERPVVDFFGPIGVFEGQHLVTSLGNTFVVRFVESGSGFNPDDVQANFAQIGTYGTRRVADSCSGDDSVWECVWENIDVDYEGTVFLVGARDKVGNAAEIGGVQSAVVIDEVAPSIGNVEVIALADNEGNVRSYFQSRDVLEITFDVSELNGVVASVDVSDIVNDGGVLEAACERDGIDYSCRVTTDRIKSGFDPDAQIDIIAEDFAGNVAHTLVGIQILGLDDETDPDFWSHGDVDCSPDGLDINTVKLASQRVFCSVPFETDVPDVEILAFGFVECSDESGVLADAYLMNNLQGSVTPYLVLEFDTFTENINSADFECTMHLTTRRGTVVIEQVEEATLNVTVPFFVTSFDKELSSLEDEIATAREDAGSGFNGLIGTLNDIFQWVLILCGIMRILYNLYIIIEAFSEGLEALRATVFATPLAIAGCESTGAIEVGTGSIIKTLQTICLLASCSPSAHLWDNWYTQWQADVLKFYNTYTLRSALGTAAEATSLSDNLPLSVIGLCLPGVVFNLEKLRQVECRYVGCLENDVKAGIATVEACRELRDYQECKYIWGEVFQFIPFVGGLDALLGILKSLLTDPVGIANMAAVALCTAALCKGSNTARSVCNYVAVFIFLLDVINQVISAFDYAEVATEGDYCSQVDL